MIKLWEENVPYNTAELCTEPFMTPYMVEGAKACVIICPGGAYCFLCLDKEGEWIAQMFNKNGISAFILNYRIAPKYHNPAILEDVLRAVRVARREAKTYGYDENKIAVMGFSAGGHLASMALTKFDYGKDTGDETDKISSRPDMGILCYPVITMDDYTHSGSRKNLLGDTWEDQAMRDEFSSEKNVRDDTPPCFIFHTAADKGVLPKNAMAMANALIEKNIITELHIFPFPGHGMGMGHTPDAMHASQWVGLLLNFIREYLLKS